MKYWKANPTKSPPSELVLLNTYMEVKLKEYREGRASNQALAQEYLQNIKPAI